MSKNGLSWEHENAWSGELMISSSIKTAIIYVNSTSFQARTGPAGYREIPGGPVAIKKYYIN